MVEKRNELFSLSDIRWRKMIPEFRKRLARPAIDWVLAADSADHGDVVGLQQRIPSLI